MKNLQYPKYLFIICIGLVLLEVLALQTNNSSFQKAVEEITLDVKNGDNLKETYPDSAVYFYQKAITQIDDLYNDNLQPDEKNSLQFREVDLQIKIGYIFHMQCKYSFAKDYYEKAYKSAAVLGNDSLIAESSFNLGEINLENGKYVDAINAYDKALELFHKINYTNGIIWTHLGLGIVYRECGNTDLSKSHYFEAKKISEQNGDPYLVGMCNNNIGNLFGQIRDYSSAIKYLKLALKNFEESGNEKFISDCYDSIGNLYFNYGDYEKAIEYFKNAISIAQKLSDQYRLLSLYANYAKTYSALGENETALMYFSKTIELAQSIGDKARMSEIHILIADFYKQKNDYSNSLEQLKKSLSISREVGDTVSIAAGLNAIADIYDLLGDKDSALKSSLEAYNISKSINLIKCLKDASYYLAEYYSQKGLYKEAYQYQLDYTFAKDSLLNAEKIKILEETEAKFNLEKLESEKLKIQAQALKAKEQVETQNLLIIILGISILIAGSLFGRYFYKKRNEKKEQIEKSHKLTRKIDLLNSQINAKNRELTSQALMISKNNKVLADAVESIDTYLKNEVEDKKELKQLKYRLQNIYEEESWKDFLKHFEEVHPNFYKTLAEKYEDLTPSELKICAFLRMNLNTKDIAKITGQTTKSIEVARTRIRKKMSIDHSQNLSAVLRNI